MENSYFVYIMSNESRMLYVGVTNDVTRRSLEHKSKSTPGFTKKYNLYKLVYFEEFANIPAAIAREKQIKGWVRSKKVALIGSKNPEWKDLAEAHFKSAQRFEKLASNFAKGTTVSRFATKRKSLSS